jgi:hypothetical protein
MVFPLFELAVGHGFSPAETMGTPTSAQRSSMTNALRNVRHMSVMKRHHYRGQFRQADRPDYVVSDVDPVFAATLVIARRASAETDSEIATSC